MSIRFKTFITELNVIPGNAATVVQGIAGRFPNTFKRATRDDQPEGTPLSSPRTSEKDRGSDLGFVVNAKKEDEINAQKPEAKRKLETDALKKVVRSDEYKNASEEERSKMLETGISSVGDAPSIEGSDAEFRVSQDQRAKNIDSQTRKDFESMTPEEKMLTPDEMRKQGLIGSKYGQKKSVSTGRPVNPNNPFGPKISTPDDKNSKYQYIPNKPRQYANRDRAKLFAAQDDLSTLKQGIGDRARQRIQRDSPILNQADRDIASMNRETATAKRQSIAKASFGKQP